MELATKEPSKARAAALPLAPLAASSAPSAFTARGIGGGGALYSPSINPGNNNEFYVACDMTELFHSADFGGNYSQVHYAQMHGSIHSKVCFTSTAGLLYSISSDPNDVGMPVKSVDGGVTWTVLTGNPDATEPVLGIFADYANPNRVIIASYGYMYFSSDGGASFTLFHTTANTGVGTIAAGAFFSGSTIYVGSNDGVLVSSNSGATWTVASISGIPATQVIVSFAAAKVGSTTRFFCLTALKADFYVGLTGSDYWNFAKGVYTCDYGSTNWASKLTGINLASDFPTLVKMAENDINTVYLAGSNSSSFPTVFKTTNAGASWTNTFLTTNNQNITTGWSGQGGDKQWYYGECALGFDVAANNANQLVLSDFGFVHKSSNGGTSWEQAYVDASTQNAPNSPTPAKKAYASCGIENTSAWQLLWSDINNVFAAYSDITGIRSVDGGINWSFNYTGNTANTTYRVAKGSNGTLYAATSNIHDIYQSTRLADAQLDAADPNGKLIYSVDKGATWQDLKVFGHPVVWVALDPNNPNVAYASVIHYSAGAGIGGVYRTANLLSLAASTWTLLPSPPSTEKHPACLEVLNDGKLVATYSGRRNAAGAFTASSGVFIYDSGSNAWTNVTHAGMKYWTRDVVIDPSDVAQNTWYVNVCSGWGGAPDGLGGLYKTTNRGTSWSKLTGSTIDRTLSCTVNPGNANELYLTTEGQGLWMSTDIQSANPTFSQVSAYNFRQPERVFFNPYNTAELWVTSFGNGLKVGDTGASSCGAFTLSATSVSVPATATTGTVGVSGAAGCPWTAISNATPDLVVTSGASGSGNGTVGYSVTANTGVARSGTITIAGQTFTVNQAAGTASCGAFTLSTTSVSIAAAAYNGTVTVTGTAGCPWTAVSNAAPDLTITAGASGSGNGVVSYSVTANTGAARTGTMTIAGQTVTVNQAAAAGGSVVNFYTNETAPPLLFTTVPNIARVVVAQGVGNSNCIKFSGTGLTGYALTPQISFANAIDISALKSTDKLRIVVKWTATAAIPASAYLAIYFNGMWDQVVYTPAFGGSTAFKTFDISIASIRAAMGNSLNNIYFSAGDGFPAGSIVRIDSLGFVS